MGERKENRAISIQTPPAPLVDIDKYSLCLCKILVFSYFPSSLTFRYQLLFKPPSEPYISLSFMPLSIGNQMGSYLEQSTPIHGLFMCLLLLLVLLLLGKNAHV